MPPKLIIATLSTLCLTACHERLELNPPPPPEEYLECEELPEKPDFKPLEVYTGPMGGLYFKPDVDARDRKIADYILLLRGAYFACSNSLEAIREYYEEQ